MILDKIVEQKRLQLKDEMEQITIENWVSRIINGPMLETRSFLKAIKRTDSISIIAEVKKASPSKGIIKEDFDPLKIAREYNASDVQAISVLTEKNFFQGSDEHLVKIKRSVSIPVLRKDFIIDVWQIYQSRYLGADAILLIASILTNDELKKFQVIAGMLGMQCLVEVHDNSELERALETGGKVIGINNRNLKTFEVDLKTTEKLITKIPNDKAIVSESGIKTHEDMKYLRELGVDAVLIGETLMRAEAIREKIDELRNGMAI